MGGMRWDEMEGGRMRWDGWSEVRLDGRDEIGGGRMRWDGWSEVR